MKWLRRALLFLFAAAVVVMIALAFRKKPIPVEVAKVERGEFVEVVEEPGKTRVRERFVISAPVSGELARIQKKPGDAVEAQDVLATIRPVAPSMMDARMKGELEARLQAALASQTLANAAVDKAKTVKSYAEKEVARLKGLVDKGASPERDLEKAELELRVADKDLKTAELSAHVAAHEVEVARAATTVSGKTETAWSVRSPLKGRVLRVLQTSEGVVAAGTPLLEVADPNDLEVVVGVLTSDAVRIAPGARSILERWGGPGALEGRVRKIEPSGYTKLSALGVEEQRVDVVIDIVSPPNLWSALGDGFRVHTRTIVFRQPDALKTASATLFREGNEWALFVVADGRAAKRLVHVERRNGPEVVLSGIDPGTTVVNFPSSALSDGAAVVVR